MVGIGGGILVIPILMIGFGFSQAKANGTSMAMLLPPIGLFAVTSYWRAGNIDLAYAMLLAIGFAGGAHIGAVAVNAGRVNPSTLRATFAALLLYVVWRMLFRPGGHGRAAIEAALVLVGFGSSYLLLRLGRKIGNKTERLSGSVKSIEMTDSYDYEI
jgi:uncharacterized membrane protein YfcA